MTESIPRESARIYQFPIRDRATKVGHRESPKKIADLASVGYADAEFGSGWYHGAAIRDDELANKR